MPGTGLYSQTSSLLPSNVLLHRNGRLAVVTPVLWRSGGAGQLRYYYAEGLWYLEMLAAEDNYWALSEANLTLAHIFLIIIHNPCKRVISSLSANAVQPA